MKTIRADVPRILHALNLDTIGGVERLFQSLLSTETSIRQTDVALITGGRAHPDLLPSPKTALSDIVYTKYLGPFKLPKKPRFIRRRHETAAVRKLQPDLGVIWNRFGDNALIEALRKAHAKAIYYEHGFAWLAPDNADNRRFLQSVDAVIAVTRAARRVLELRWHFAGPTHVVLNPLRPELGLLNVAPRALPTDRPLRIGVAGRLIPLKGIGVTLHAVKYLLDRRRDIELHVAGTGPLESFLNNQTQALALQNVVRFHGYIPDMSNFYSDIDVLLVPSVREPFGLVSLEAAAYGCPVIGARVDGIPETMLDGETGICLRPNIPARDGLGFGGRAVDLPLYVYDPDRDALSEPRFLDPADVGAAVESLLDNPASYYQMSAKAISHAKTFSMAVYAQHLRDIFSDTLGR